MGRAGLEPATLGLKEAHRASRRYEGLVETPGNPVIHPAVASAKFGRNRRLMLHLVATLAFLGLACGGVGLLTSSRMRALKATPT